MQGHNLMTNHIATLQPLNPPNIAFPTYSVQKTGEYWAHTNKTIGEVIIHLGQMNAVIWPETRKNQRVQAPNEGARQTKMDKTICKWDRTPFPRNLRYRGHQHMFLYSQAWVTPRQKDHTQPHSMQHQTPEDQTHIVRLTVGGDKFHMRAQSPPPQHISQHPNYIGTVSCPHQMGNTSLLMSRTSTWKIQWTRQNISR